jgi:hypothetical protein
MNALRNYTATGNAIKLKLVDSGRPKGYGPSNRPRRLARPRTPPFHGDNTGSNPVGDANKSSSLLIDSNILKREVLERFKIPLSLE